jgi:Putative phage metallopeptidase
MPQTYHPAENVDALVSELVPQYHTHLATARILCLFQETASKKNGKVIQGVAKKLSGVMQHYAEGDFLLLIALDQWNELSGDRRTALVDHLLERCNGEEDEASGGMKWSMREPDVHEFSSILHRYGTYNDDLVGFLDVARTLDEGLVGTLDVASRVEVRSTVDDETG